MPARVAGRYVCRRIAISVKSSISSPLKVKGFPRDRMTSRTASVGKFRVTLPDDVS